MTIAPAIPPDLRSWSGLRLAAGAAQGTLRLPTCEDCGAVSYPPLETCRTCLGDRLAWRAVDGAGIVISSTWLRHSPDTYYKARLPLLIGVVRLDAGPAVMAFLAADCAEIGKQVTVDILHDPARRAVLAARAAGSESQTWEGLMTNRTIEGKTVLITGAMGGIGRALVAAFAAAGAGTVLAGRHDQDVAVAGGSKTVRRVTVDVTDQASVDAVVAANDVDILVNNAGVNFNEGLLSADGMRQAADEIAVNYLGSLRMIRAVAPGMRARGSGIVVNLLTVLAHVNLPMMGSYCASKAAGLSMTQGVRAELAPWGVRVVGIFPGATDTRMTANLPPPKMPPAAVARAVVEAITSGKEDSFPGDMATGLHEKLRADAKAVEHELAGMLPRIG